MRYLQTFEMWTTDMTGDFDISYGDKPKLSKIVIDTIDFIENNKNNIKEDILNDNKENLISFKHGLKYTSIKLDKRNDLPILHFSYYDYDNNFGYTMDITYDEYIYLKDYFLDVYKETRKKAQAKEEEEYDLKMKGVEDRRIKKDANKYNL